MTVQESSKKLLLQKLWKLERNIEELERKFEEQFKTVDLENLADEFIRKVLDDYWNLLDSSCKEMERKLRSPKFDREDLIQECLEYLLRWCMDKVRAKSTKYKVWLPYLKRSLQNCFVNIASKEFTKMRRGYAVELTTDIIETYADNQVDVESEYEFKELVHMVRDKLCKTDRKIMDIVLTPSIGFLTFYSICRAYYKAEGLRFSQRRIIAEFLDLDVSTVNYRFNRIKNTIKECSA